jgi:hypothetical protein
MLLVPEGGADVNVRVLPAIEYADVGSCCTFSTNTSQSFVPDATDSVKSTVDASPEKVSFVTFWKLSAGLLPKYAIGHLLG